MPVSSQRPPGEVLAWVQQTIGGDARVVAWRRLTGGLTSYVHRLTVEHNGRRRSYVLRRFATDGEPGPWIRNAFATETKVLVALERSGVPVPRLIGATTESVHGGPAVLMTRVPGRIHLMPSDRERWLRQIAQMLARIHALDIWVQPFESWLERDRLAPPPDARHPDVWQAAFALVANEQAPTHTCFIHRDFQHYNLLWSRERLSGVVDWLGASNGPPEVDVGHCCLNLTVLFSADVADRFLAMYESEVGRRCNAWWDIQSLLSFGPEWKKFIPVQLDGRAPFDADGLTGRMEEVLARALRRA